MEYKLEKKCAGEPQMRYKYDTESHFRLIGIYALKSKHRDELNSRIF